MAADSCCPPRAAAVNPLPMTTTKNYSTELATGLALRGLIFDFDGTLAATLPLCYEAMRRTVQHYTGRVMSDRDIHATFGPSEEGILQRLLPGVPLDESLATFMKMYAAEHHLCPVPFPGIVEMLENLRGGGIRLALVTGKGPLSARHSLAQYALDEFFECVETGHPDGHVKAAHIRRICEAWGLPSESVAYVGDDPTDVIQAREAGVISVSAAWDNHAPIDKQRECGPDAQFHSLAEFMTWVESNSANDNE